MPKCFLKISNLRRIFPEYNIKNLILDNNKMIESLMKKYNLSIRRLTIDMLEYEYRCQYFQKTSIKNSKYIIFL